MFGAVIAPPSPLFKRPSAPALSSSIRPPATTRLPITCASTCRAPPSMPRRFSDLVSRKPPASLYEVLQVNQTASAMEIKTAYRTMAKLHHPDATSQADSDGRDFIEIHNAYATLSDPASRAMYDLSLGRRLQRAVERSDQVYATRRWETDQCW